MSEAKELGEQILHNIAMDDPDLSVAMRDDIQRLVALAAPAPEAVSGVEPPAVPVQKPVAWVFELDSGDMGLSFEQSCSTDTPLYTHPAPSVERQPLSEEQVTLITNDGMRNAAGGIYETCVMRLVRAVEQHHGIPQPAQEKDRG